MRQPLHLVNVDVKLTAHLSVSWILTNTRFFLIRWGLKKCKMHYRPLAKKKIERQYSYINLFAFIQNLDVEIKSVQ